MSHNFEDQLRQALCHVEPPEGFAERVLAKVNRGRSERRIWYGSIAAGLALMLSLGGLALDQREQRRRAELTERQVVFALSLAADKVNHVNTRLQRSAPHLEITQSKEGTL